MSVSWLQLPLTVLNEVNTTAAQSSNNGFLSYFNDTDVIGKTLFVILIVMAIITWYLIFYKTIAGLIRKGRSREFLKKFWDNHTDLHDLRKQIEEKGTHDMFSRLTKSALVASSQYEKYTGQSGFHDGSVDFVTRSIRRSIEAETAKIESGLTLLSSIGSTAPFVGLFGTVWGVYHALMGISHADGVTINQVAGPIGEALVMTGLGLAVAIPAVLALNAFVRRNRLTLAKLDGFAYDVLGVVTTSATGSAQHLKANSNQHVTPAATALADKSGINHEDV
ncbi:MotA/TolQ/ExbB proton channel family protein [Brackiella oedipodis]|uniref:MotA/TolQ/ExbB proton channel family protein n=1 Tax=Brackiella oedipodis TaxID=124225 RepID=UPI000688D209|nr:MotA/TolQ/ExbB proton channel family protein [Brackiella oedipodis]